MRQGKILIHIDGHFTPEAMRTIDEVHRWSTKQARLYATLVTQRREQECRRAVVESLRPRLRWLVDHPRLLKLLYRVAPSWKPTVGVHTISTAGQ